MLSTYPTKRGPVATMSDDCFEPIQISDPDLYDSPCAFPYNFYDELFLEYGDSSKLPIDEKHKCVKVRTSGNIDHCEQKELMKNLSTVKSREWLDEAEASSKVIIMPTKVRKIFCNVLGITRA